MRAVKMNVPIYDATSELHCSLCPGLCSCRTEHTKKINENTLLKAEVVNLSRTIFLALSQLRTCCHHAAKIKEHSATGPQELKGRV